LKHYYLFKDTQTFLQDIRHQVERLSFNRKALKNTRIEIAGEVLSKTVSLFDSVARTNGIRTAKITHLKDNGFFELPPVFGDADALLMVFRNLVENAIRYRKIDSSECLVELRHAVSDTHVTIWVVDHGIGIPEEEEASIFEEGYRAENAVAQYPASTGLGLHQAMELLKRMNANISITSCKPTTFCVVLKRY
jgi:signal transduction histidine kinase